MVASLWPWERFPVIPTRCSENGLMLDWTLLEESEPCVFDIQMLLLMMAVAEWKVEFKFKSSKMEGVNHCFGKKGWFMRKNDEDMSIIIRSKTVSTWTPYRSSNS